LEACARVVISTLSRLEDWSLPLTDLPSAIAVTRCALGLPCAKNLRNKAE